MTSSEGWRWSCAQVERKSTELTQIADETLKAQRLETPMKEKSKEASVACVGKTGKTLPDNARKRKVKANEMEKTRVNETKTVSDKLMGSRAQLPSGS